MNDPTRRALRTLLQASFPLVVIQLLAGFDVIHWTAAQTALVMGVVTPIVGFIQNLLEDRTSFPSIPALLKAPASSGVNPVPEEPAAQINPNQG